MATLLLAVGLPPARAGEPAPTPVTLQLKWRHQFQFAGYYAALEQGYYRAAGLDVRLREAQPDEDPISAVLAGQAEFGVGTSELVLRRALGDPVVILAVIFQHSPQILLARRDAGVAHIHDLIGKRVMLEHGTADLVAYLRREQIPLERLDIRPHGFDVQALIAGEVDAISAYITDEPFLTHQSGMETLIMTPRAIGIDFYGDNLFTTESYLRQYPERVRAFRAASLRGWQHAMAYPEATVDLILNRYSQRHGRDHLRYEAQQMRELIQPVLVELGYMNPGRWRHIAETFAAEGLLPKAAALPPAGLLYDPDPGIDLRQLYQILGAIGALLLAGGLVLFNMQRLNRRLRREVRERLAAESKFRGLVEQSLAGIYILRQGRFMYVNPKFAQIFGYRAEALLDGVDPLDLVALTDRERIAGLLSNQNDDGPRDLHLVFAALRQNGTPLDVEMNGRTIDYEGRPAILGIALDVTEQKRAEQRLNYLAFYDPLTELPNRALFFDRLGEALTQNRRDRVPFALLMLDLDGFKAVNDTHGHDTGDALLIAVGQRLRDCIRASDTLARMGGDEFTLILRHLDPPEGAMRVADKILEALRTPFDLDGRHCQVGASIGICIVPDDGTDMESLLSRADAAMYRSKAQGKNLWTRYRPTLSGHAPPRLKLALLDWTEELAVGVPAIDAQHRELVRLINAIGEAAARGEDEARIASLLDGLNVFARHHFATEEGLMDAAGYEGAALHRQAHDRLLADLLGLREQLDGASLMLTLRVLKDWLIHHIRHSDRDLGRALRGAGHQEP